MRCSSSPPHLCVYLEVMLQTTSQKISMFKNQTPATHLLLDHFRKGTLFNKDPADAQHGSKHHHMHLPRVLFTPCSAPGREICFDKADLLDMFVCRKGTCLQKYIIGSSWKKMVLQAPANEQQEMSAPGVPLLCGVVHYLSHRLLPGTFSPSV